MKSEPQLVRLRRFFFLVGLIAVAFLATERLAAQDAIDIKHNADGSTTSKEDLGDGARATTKDAKGELKDVVTSEANSKYGAGGTKVTVVNKAGKDSVTELYKDAAGNVREVSFTQHNVDYVIDKYEFEVKYNEKGEVTSWDEKKNDKPVEHGKEESTPDGQADAAKIARKKADQIRWPAEQLAHQRLDIEFGADSPAKPIEPAKVANAKTLAEAEELMNADIAYIWQRGHNMGEAFGGETDIGEFWSEDVADVYEGVLNLFMRYRGIVKKGVNVSEDFLTNVDHMMDAFKTQDQQFQAQLKQLAELYPKRKQIIDDYKTNPKKDEKTYVDRLSKINEEISNVEDAAIKAANGIRFTLGLGGIETRSRRPTNKPSDTKAGDSPSTPTSNPTNTETTPVEPKNSTPPATDPKPATNIIPASDTNVIPNIAKGFSTYVTTPPGLNTIVMTSPDKDVLEIYLPRSMVAGQSFTGSIKIKPSYKHLISDSEFTRYTLKIGEQTIPMRDGTFTVKLGPDSLNHLRLIDDQGKTITGIDFSSPPAPPPPKEIEVPNSSTIGQLLEIAGPCSGSLGAGDSVKIGGKQMPVIAVSNGSVIIRNDFDQAGLNEIEINLCGASVKKPLRVLTLNVSADSLNLMKGESTTVHILVGGLEKLRAPAHMTIAVTGTVTMTGATRVELDPSMIAANGTYSTDRSLHAVAAGGFGVNVTVKVDKEP